MILSLIFSIYAMGTEPKSNDQLYQLDFRERISLESELPVIGGFEIQGSFETRYRPKKPKPAPQVDDREDSRAP